VATTNFKWHTMDRNSETICILAITDLGKGSGNTAESDQNHVSSYCIPEAFENTS
jgi:hypothetical protein